MVRGRCRSTPALPTTEESESETGLDPEVAAEIEQIPDELQQIVDGALAYFAAATWPIVPSAAVFFGEGGSTMQLFAASMGGWLLIAVANSVPVA